MCAEVNGSRLCVNPNFGEAGFCPDDFICIAPEPEPEPELGGVGADEGGAEAELEAGATVEVGGVSAGVEVDKEVRSDDSGCQSSSGGRAPLGLLLMVVILLSRRRLSV